MVYIRHNVWKYVFAARIVQSIGQKCITGVWGRSPQRKNGAYTRWLLEILYNISGKGGIRSRGVSSENIFETRFLKGGYLKRLFRFGTFWRGGYPQRGVLTVKPTDTLGTRNHLKLPILDVN